jgi:hypothetical protein
MSTTVDAFETFTPATGTYSWSEVVQQKTPPVPSEVMTKPNSATTPTTASLATSAFTPNHISDIQALREEYKKNRKVYVRSTRKNRRVLQMRLLNSRTCYNKL